jgi:hypothetical protein
MANVVIDIAAEFTGGNAFRKAETATDKLSNSASKLGKAFIGLYSTQKLLAYGKASVQAAVADEKAQKLLAVALRNVGLGRDIAASESYIQKLQKEFGILDDELRPAYQTLAIATQDTAESQRLFQLALDISASTGKDLGSVTAALSKAYLGNNTALSKLGVGISKADLKAKSFQEITDQLATTFAGSATTSANTLQGSMDKLAVASANAKEIIGEGLLDALESLGGDNSIDDLATSMEGLAQRTANAISGIGIIIAKLKENPILGKFLEWAAKQRGFGEALGEVKKNKEEAEAARTNYGAASNATGFEKGFGITSKIIKNSKVITAEGLKQLKVKQLQLAIDKANLALNKGSNVFDIEKIQLAAAEKNQAEQLAKITSQAQLLQITNDLARLQVKKSINDLEDAIASKDVAAITAATNKLNADLKVLGALNSQKVKLTEIDDILKGILPKKLIDMANLDEAIAKLTALGKTSATATGTSTATTSATALTPAEINERLAKGSFVPIDFGTSGVTGGSTRAGDYAPSGFPGASGGGTTKVEVTVVAPPFTDPNAVAEIVNQYLTDAIDRGTLRGLAVA